MIPDIDRKIINDYGVWGPKEMFGLKFEGIYRTTFVIDEKGKIEKIFKKVNSGAHSEQILESLGLL